MRRLALSGGHVASAERAPGGYRFTTLKNVVFALEVLPIGSVAVKVARYAPGLRVRVPIRPEKATLFKP